jgi:hypothetical protein
MSKIIQFKIFILAIASLCSCSTSAQQNIGADNDSIFVAGRESQFKSEDDFLDYIQKVHLNYMWDGAEPTSGLARERIHLDGEYPENDVDVVTIGGSGFGIAGLLVGIQRGFIPRQEGVDRLTKIVDYLAHADRFHGVWPHWLYGPTGKVKPFGHKRRRRRPGRKLFHDAESVVRKAIFYDWQRRGTNLVEENRQALERDGV